MPDPVIMKGLFSLGSSLATNATNYSLTQQTNAQNAHLARLQNSYNLEQWFRENAYNSPFQQMQRLKQAGINPAMAYTDGIENVSAQSPAMVSSQAVAPRVTNPFDAYLQAELVSAQSNQMNTQAEVNQTKLPYLESLTNFTNVKINLGNFDLMHLKPAQKEKIVAETKNLNQSTKNLEESLNAISLDNVYRSLSIDKERFYQHFYMEKDYSSTIGLRESTMFKNKADAIETVFLMKSKLLLNKALRFQANTQGNLNIEKAKTEESVRFRNLEEGNYMKSKADLVDVERKFKSALYKADDYVQLCVDSLRFSNEKLQVELNIDKGKNFINYHKGKNNFGDFNFFESFAGDFDWTINHLLQVAPFGFGSSNW